MCLRVLVRLLFAVSDRNFITERLRTIVGVYVQVCKRFSSAILEGKMDEA